LTMMIEDSNGNVGVGYSWIFMGVSSDQRVQCGAVVPDRSQAARRF
jgi:hypothetical protein